MKESAIALHELVSRIINILKLDLVLLDGVFELNTDYLNELELKTNDVFIQYLINGNWCIVDRSFIYIARVFPNKDFDLLLRILEINNIINPEDIMTHTNRIENDSITIINDLLSMDNQEFELLIRLI